MPCNYYSPEEERQMERQKAATYKNELDEATRLLCGIMTIVENNGEFLHREMSWVPGLEQWWERHMKMDAQRIKEDK